jgi:hypothetical protein
MLGRNIDKVGIIRPCFTPTSAPKVTRFKYTLVHTIAHSAIGIEHGIDGGISGDIEVDGVVPKEGYAGTIPDVYRIKRELGHLVLNGVGLGIRPGKGLQLSGSTGAIACTPGWGRPTGIKDYAARAYIQLTLGDKGGRGIRPVCTLGAASGHPVIIGIARDQVGKVGGVRIEGSRIANRGGGLVGMGVWHKGGKSPLVGKVGLHFLTIGSTKDLIENYELCDFSLGMFIVKAVRSEHNFTRPPSTVMRPTSIDGSLVEVGPGVSYIRRVLGGSMQVPTGVISFASTMKPTVKVEFIRSIIPKTEQPIDVFGADYAFV